MDDNETEKLIGLAQSGDRSAIARLFSRCRDRLRNTIAIHLDRRVSARVDPSDVMQDVMAKATEKMPQYLEQRPMDFYPWLRQLVRDQLVDVHRRHVQAECRSVRREAYSPELTDTSAHQLVDHLLGSAATPSAIFGQQERRNQIRHALSQLPGSDQEILLMRFVEQMPIQEVAQVLSLSEAAAKSRLRRALEKMYRLISSPKDDFHAH